MDGVVRKREKKEEWIWRIYNRNFKKGVQRRAEGLLLFLVRKEERSGE